MQVPCLKSSDFAFSLQILLVDRFYLKGIHSSLVIRRKNILVFSWFCVSNKWLKKNIKKLYVVSTEERKLKFI
jgi:hypothetical protein